jgi:hypothetical protein
MVNPENQFFLFIWLKLYQIVSLIYIGKRKIESV